MATPFEEQVHDLKNLNAIISLARLGTDKVILNHFRGMIDYRGVVGLINRYYTPIGVAHRKGSYWLRSLEGRVVGDRLLRLFIGVYSFDEIKDDITAPQLLKLFKLYHAMWPADEISTNRIYYYFLALRSQDVIALPSCAKCQQAFVFHKEDGGLCCSACEGMKLAKHRLARIRAQEERARLAESNQQPAPSPVPQNGTKSNGPEKASASNGKAKSSTRRRSKAAKVA